MTSKQAGQVNIKDLKIAVVWFLCDVLEM